MSEKEKDETYDDYLERIEIEKYALADYEREIELYGISDGWKRLPIDPDYAHEPIYLSGHRQGLAMPVETAPGFGDP